MLRSGAVTQAEPLEKGCRSKEDKMITWEILVPSVHLDFCFEVVTTEKYVFEFI